MFPRSRRLLVVTVVLLALGAGLYTHLSAQVQAPRPADLRFQALLSQPIATPDRKSVVAGTSTLLLMDRDTGQCYVVVTIGNSAAMSTAACPK